MKHWSLALALALGATALPDSARGQPGAAASKLHVDTQYFTLPNGLKVVLTKDTIAPTVTVAVYYGIGFRVEPKDRTGFAHLFEHLMFQGSKNAPKGVFDKTITNSGGVNNGSTRFDYTNYYEVVPSGALERMLWLEADRMANPVIDATVLKNQQGVVGNEIKVNVLNQPYSTWPWIDLPMLANVNWYNSHNFYGELKEVEAATVPDAQAFSKRFYRPNNAVLVIAGDIDYAATRVMVEKYFSSIPAAAPVEQPDISEPRQTAEKFRSRVDALAPKPGYAAGYHVPERGTPEWYAMGLIDQILVKGDDSRLYRKIVQETGIAGELGGGINADLGNMFNYRGPMLWSFSFTHDPTHTTEQITKVVDEVIEDLRTKPVSAAELERARTKMRSDLYGTIDGSYRLGLVDLLAVYALFNDNPDEINRIEEGFVKVTPELIQKTAQEYLRKTNRSIYVVEPAAARSNAAKGGK
ncbi:pitrilysin family protein [Sphingosinicella sp. LY1275]|uniref:M16 family metallopeptidase n=1 Tax=Sphingosinicella sp. LY1275 TaxID=3095379 RepID=UPI002ADEDC92|nr:pitrilysin family protein [Sphingosinicella sp. LY1275]MEA1013720.1 pitrilysin family protein [Sphingosinicella sp. LY1275]